MFATIILGF